MRTVFDDIVIDGVTAFIIHEALRDCETRAEAKALLRAYNVELEISDELAEEVMVFLETAVDPESRWKFAWTFKEDENA